MFVQALPPVWINFGHLFLFYKIFGRWAGAARYLMNRLRIFELGLDAIFWNVNSDQTSFSHPLMFTKRFKNLLAVCHVFVRKLDFVLPDVLQLLSAGLQNHFVLQHLCIFINVLLSIERHDGVMLFVHGFVCFCLGQNQLRAVALWFSQLENVCCQIYLPLQRRLYCRGPPLALLWRTWANIMCLEGS